MDIQQFDKKLLDGSIKAIPTDIPEGETKTYGKKNNGKFFKLTKEVDRTCDNRGHRASKYYCDKQGQVYAGRIIRLENMRGTLDDGQFAYDNYTSVMRNLNISELYLKGIK